MTDKQMPERIKCSGCGKELPPLNLDENDDGLEGYIARNLPTPAAAWCSDECYQRGTLQ